MMAEETATLAAYVADLKFADIPHEVLERAKVLTLDFLGSAIRARRDAESTPSLLKMLEALALDGKGHSTVFGDAKTWTPAVAALLNGALGHSLDFDDTTRIRRCIQARRWCRPRSRSVNWSALPAATC